MQGIWESADDPAYVIEIAADRFEGRYSGEGTRSAKLTFVTSCEDDTEAPDGQYFTLTDDDGPICYYLLRAEADVLEYSYVARGNTLSFRRMPLDAADANPTIATITSLASGDRACYAEMLDEQGGSVSMWRRAERRLCWRMS